MQAVCSIKFRSQPNSQVRYDDSLVITLENLVMAANGFSDRRFETSLEKNEKGLYKYDFLRLKHGGYDKNHLNCAAGVDCNITRSEAVGQFRMDVKEEWFDKAQLFSGEDVPEALSVKAIVAGNKQDTDCQHTGFTFDVDIKYVKE